MSKAKMCCSVCGVSQAKAKRHPLSMGFGLAMCNQCQDKPLFCVICGFKHLATAHRDDKNAQEALAAAVKALTTSGGPS